jgi:hypothetical protein
MGAGDPVDIVGDLMDPEHRLPGERDSEASPLLEDAQHWLNVYGELLAFKRTLLRTAEIHKEGAAEAVVAEVSGDQVLLQSELDRLERRHRFWQARALELQRSPD